LVLGPRSELDSSLLDSSLINDEFIKLSNGDDESIDENKGDLVDKLWIGDVVKLTGSQNIEEHLQCSSIQPPDLFEPSMFSFDSRFEFDIFIDF
jgi:hypothetical protein